MRPAPENLPEILAGHASWLAGKGGHRAVFRSRDLSGTSFSGADLRRACFSCANLSGCDFSGASLEHANFVLARMQGANLNGAACTGTIFLFANLTNAKVDDACLKNAILFGANLSGAVSIRNFRLWMRANPMLMMATYMILLLLAMAIGAEAFIRFLL